MVGEALFVEVRIPGVGTVSARHAKAPGACIDGVLESTQVDSSSVRHTVLAIARGLSVAQVDALLVDLAESYGEPARLLERTPSGDAILRYAIAIRDLQSPTMRALARFQRAMGVPWIHAEAGEVLLRAQARGPAEAEAAVDRVQRYLSDYGVPGGVSVRTPTAADLDVHARLLALLSRFAWGGVEAGAPSAPAR